MRSVCSRPSGAVLLGETTSGTKDPRAPRRISQRLALRHKSAADFSYEVPLAIDWFWRVAAGPPGSSASVHARRERRAGEGDAGIPNARGIFTGCYEIGTGDVRLIRGAMGCRPGERRVTWRRERHAGRAGTHRLVGTRRSARTYRSARRRWHTRGYGHTGRARPAWRRRSNRPCRARRPSRERWASGTTRVCRSTRSAGTRRSTWAARLCGPTRSSWLRWPPRTSWHRRASRPARLCGPTWSAWPPLAPPDLLAPPGLPGLPVPRDRLDRPTPRCRPRSRARRLPG